MNEITRIHLGRQPYTISVEAHQELKKYLADIERQADDPEIVQEVELRMAELLTERGITGDKAILPEDIDYLKEQLGHPGDFREAEDDSETSEQAEDKTSKRLFRDTDNAMLAGVSAGLAQYSGLDAVLIRLIFVLLAIFGSGLGIVLYVLFWLFVPPAETASEKLQMQGKPVTLDALKNTVAKADPAGTVRRGSAKALPVINNIFQIFLKLIGIGFILAGFGILAGIAATKMYMLLHSGRLIQENYFPIGAREEWLVILAMVLAAIVALFLMLTGIATFKRKWPIRGWITGVLVGLFILTAAASSVLAADAAPRIRERYEASMHTSAVQNIQPFNRVVSSGQIDFEYFPSSKYAVNMRYADHPDLKKVKIHVTDNTLYVDSSELDATPHCDMLCLFPRYNMTVQVYAPNVERFATPPNTGVFYPAPTNVN